VTHALLDDYSGFLYPLGALSITLLLFLIIFDARFWKGNYKYAAGGLFALNLLLILGTGVTFNSRFSGASLCAYVLLCFVILLLVRVSVYRKEARETFLVDVYYGMFCLSLLLLTAWGVLVFSKEWNTAVQVGQIYCSAGFAFGVLIINALLSFRRKRKISTFDVNNKLRYVKTILNSSITLV
jgi:hypothetical protein